jgi:hypothetical protein
VKRPEKKQMELVQSQNTIISGTLDNVQSYIYIIIYTCIMWMGFRLILPGGRTHVQPGTKFATQKPFYTNHFDPKHIHMSYPSSDVLVCFCESWTVCYNSSFTLSTLQGKEEPRDAHTGNHVRRCKASAEDAVAEAMVVE